MPEGHNGDAPDSGGAAPGSGPKFRTPRILVVDDDPANLDILNAALEEEGYTVHAARDGARALDLAARITPDAVLLDVVMAGMDGYEVCRALKQDARMAHTPILFITAHDAPDARLDAFRAGGVDCIGKPFEPAEVRARVRVHVQLARLRARLAHANDALESRIREAEEANQRLREEAERRRTAEAGRDRAEARAAAVARREAEQFGVDAIVGESPAMARVLDDLRTLRGTSVDVLISGESGTGKELVARALHLQSDRDTGPFIAVNCAAIPAELAESVLFGHVRGAFSGATADQDGFFVAAQGGTLFLDEVGAMPLDLQPKLLRALEDRHVTPVGGTREIRVDVRVISATNADPATEIEVGRLRRDLYFRLARYPLALPPLREREHDIERLAQHFLRRFALEMGRPEPDIDPAALHALRGYSFPGNVRELRNMIEHALLRSRDGRITTAHIHFLEAEHTASQTRHLDPDSYSPPQRPPGHDPATTLLAYLREHPAISNRDVRSLLGINRRQATYMLNRLVDEGTLARSGERRWTRYHLPDDPT